MEKKITVSHKKPKTKPLAIKKVKILTVNRKSHYPIENLIYLKYKLKFFTALEQINILLLCVKKIYSRYTLFNGGSLGNL